MRGYDMELLALNDVNYNVYRGNYGKYLTQYNSNQTSQSYFRIGSKNQPYGRYARGFNSAEGKNAIFLNIDNKFFGGSPLDGDYNVTIKVIYFDQGFGSWQLKYDSKLNSQKIAYTQTNTNTGIWKEKIINVNDAYFGDRGENNSDIILFNNDTKDEIFHLVEVIRAE